jgi:UDP-glucose 4-epimerase
VNNSKDKVFITGVAGFLGSHLADRLIKKGYHVVGCDNLMGGYIDNVSPEVEFYQYDCNFLNSMKKIMRGCDVVFHCAATAYEGLSVFCPHLVTQNIVTASVAIISTAISNNVKRFVYCSSMARYGNNEVPFTEDMIPKPVDPYGIGKVAGESFLKNLSDVHGMEYVIAVPHNIIGPRQKYDDPYRNVASIFINRMLQGKQPILYGDGNQKRCFSFIHDTIQCLDRMAFQENVVGELINIGPDEEFITINRLAEVIAELLDFKLKPIYEKGRPQEVVLATCSADKARKLLDYKTEYSLKEGLKEMIEWIKKRGTKPFHYIFDLEIVNEKTPKTWKNKLI